MKRTLVIWQVVMWLTMSAHAAPPPSADSAGVDPAHQQRRHIDASERPPTSASRKHVRDDYDRPVDRAHDSAHVKASCDSSTYASTNGAALVELVRASPIDCVNALFGVTGALAGQVFAEAKMTAVAYGMRDYSASYPGDPSTGMPQLVLFLRAGYYVQYYDADDVGAYGAPLKVAIRGAIDAFAANAHFADVSDAHGQTLYEFVTLIDSAGENAYGLDLVRGLLDRYGPAYDASWYMKAAVNNTFTVLFRGHYDDAFRARVQGDAAILSTLSAFVSRNAAEVGGDQEYLLANAARELARFLQYDLPLKDSVRPRVRDILTTYSVGGPGASLWVGAAEMADYYDHDHCAYYGICGFPAQVEAVALPITHECGATLRLRAQALTPAQLAQTCATVAGEETYFHERLQTGRTPVSGDLNAKLEMVVFHSSTDYETYSGVLFGNDTNNGGIYLEGDPTAPGNQPRFIAYEAEWLRPSFEIWNLTHEYVHYLDGRFDMAGDFEATLAAPTVWWTEGLAEYMSYSYRDRPYDAAITQAATHAYPLSTVYRNDYTSGVTRIYRWGYLGVRFMFERHRDGVGGFVGDFRAGDYPHYAASLDGIGTSLDAEWDAWLTCVATPQSCAASDAVFGDGFE